MMRTVSSPVVALALTLLLVLPAEAVTPPKPPAPKPPAIKPSPPPKPVFVATPGGLTGSKASNPGLKSQSASGAKAGASVNAGPAKPQTLPSSDGIAQGQAASNPTSVTSSGVSAYKGDR